MRTVLLVAAFAAMPVALRAQNEGVGITHPQATFQVHSYTAVPTELSQEPTPAGPINPNGNGDGHTLMPLGELEAYIGANRHLPGVPTATEVEQEGADLGEMNRLLMEKVEELTLYIIDLQKQIDELKSNR